MKTLKLLIFWFLSLLPLFILIFYFIRITVDIYKINHIDHKVVFNQLEKYYAAKEPWVIPVTYELKDIDKSAFNIFVFGESSVVVSDSGTFSQYLENNLKEDGMNARVFNFGFSGMDSYSIKFRVKQAIKASSVKPGLIVFYLGHNEYNNSYNLVIKNAYPDFNYIFKPSYFFANKKDPRIIIGMEYQWYARLKKPSLINFLQNLHLVNINGSYKAEYDSLILKHFKDNLNEMLSFLDSANIPAVIVTPIGNYHAKPFGNKILVNENYEKGINEKDYNKSLVYLIKAKDNELLTYDIRAKSGLTDYLTSLHLKNVYVINLEKECIQEKFGFDDSNFLDYFHLKSSTHRIIAKKIKEKIFQDIKYCFKNNK